MTRRFGSPAEASAWAREVRSDGRTLGFVPTMGALHGGHLELVRRSVAENDSTCVSVFVNPLQFDSPDDFERYPRDVERDAELLDTVACDVVFTGTLSQFFPDSGGESERIDPVDPGPAAKGLEGDHRQGHFAGVATIVRRLFELVRPDRAYFGEKDFQQTLVVRDLARALGYPEVHVVPTVRERSGLACSSRNARLDLAGLEEATAIARGLFAARQAWAEGERSAEVLLHVLRAPVEASALEPEYVELRDPDEWSRGPLTGELTRARAFVAARLGDVRLIDNLDLADGAGTE